MGFPSGSVVKNLPTNAVDTGDEGSILELGRSPEAGNSLQYSWQENPMDRGAWWVTVHRVAKSQTWLTEHIRMCVCVCVCVYVCVYIHIYTHIHILYEDIVIVIWKIIQQLSKYKFLILLEWYVQELAFYLKIELTNF